MMKMLLRTSLFLMALLVSVTAIAQAPASADRPVSETLAPKAKRKAVAKNTKAISAKPASAATPAESAKATAPTQPTAPATVVQPNEAAAPASVGITPVVEQAPAAPLTTVSFSETTFDFGKIKQGETVKHKFVITNTGTNPLILENVKPSCGCTALDWPKDPIAPGKSGEIEAQFNSTGKSGAQLKNITITLNTAEHLERLTFTGEVIVPPTEGATPAPAAGQ